MCADVGADGFDAVRASADDVDGPVSEVHRPMGGRSASYRRPQQPGRSAVRAYLLARVSKPDQADDSRHYSIEAQRRVMRDFCLREGIEVVEERVEPGTSAFTPNIADLPVLAQTLVDIEARRADALVVHESSRLARNEQLANQVFDRLAACGAVLLNASMPMDYSTPEARLFFNQEASINAYWSRKTSQHSRKGKDEQFLQGLPVGRIHFGYEGQLGPDGLVTRKLPPVPREMEGKAVREAFLDRALGRGFEDIARDWNARGFQPGSGKAFTRRTVQAIIENPFYKGYVFHLGETRKGLHEPLVTEAEWEAAQRPKVPLTRRQLPPLLAQGLAVCARCSHPLYPSRPNRGPKYPGERYSYYREPSRDFHLDCPDAGLLWPSDVPDSILDEVVRSLTMSPEWLEHVRHEAGKTPDGADDRRQELEESLRRVQKEYFNRRLDEASYLGLRDDYLGELSTLPRGRTDLTAALDRFTAFGDLWVPASAEARNETCRVVFESVVFDMRERQIVELRVAPEFEPLMQLRTSLYVTDSPPGPGSR